MYTVRGHIGDRPTTNRRTRSGAACRERRADRLTRSSTATRHSIEFPSEPRPGPAGRPGRRIGGEGTSTPSSTARSDAPGSQRRDPAQAPWHHLRPLGGSIRLLVTPSTGRLRCSRRLALRAARRARPRRRRTCTRPTASSPSTSRDSETAPSPSAAAFNALPGRAVRPLRRPADPGRRASTTFTTRRRRWPSSSTPWSISVLRAASSLGGAIPSARLPEGRSRSGELFTCDGRTRPRAVSLRLRPSLCATVSSEDSASPRPSIRPARVGPFVVVSTRRNFRSYNHTRQLRPASPPRGRPTISCS